MSKILEANLQAFIQIQNAYDECDPEIQEIVDEMLSIARSKHATEDERKRALSTVLDALYPSLVDEAWNEQTSSTADPATIDEERRLDEQEATFAERLRAIMSQTGVTQEMLAQRTGVGQPAISNMLNRQSRPQQRTIVRFAEALGVSPEDLWPNP